MEAIIMAQVNLRDYYPSEYKDDHFIEVSDEVAAELLADKRYENAYKRRVLYNKSHYSLDADDGIEASSFACHSDNPEVIFFCMERFCNLCRALNSLPEVQGRRIEAHYLLGMSQRAIARAEGVTKGAVSISITRGLAAMKKFMENPNSMLNFCL